MPEAEKNLTKLELEIMQVLWKQGTCTVAEVQSYLARELAYTTVQTMLNILARKGKLARELDGRAYRYSAVVTEARASKHAVRDFVDRMFGGSAEELVMSLVKNKHIDAKRIAELAKYLEGKGKER